MSDTPPDGGGDSVEQLQRLMDINASELLDAFGVPRGVLRECARLFARIAARHVCARMVAYDQALGTRGLRAGAFEILPELVGRLDVSGDLQLPRTGPLLLAMNHPGLTDVLAVFATVDRNDLRVIAADYPLLRALCGVGRYLSFVPQPGTARASFVREVADHLRSGAALLLPAAGHIEPDPGVLPNAVDSARSWSNSIGVLARQVRGLQIVPVIVSGVLDPNYQRHPLTKLRRRAGDRQRLGTALQVLLQHHPRHVVRVAYGSPLTRSALATHGSDAAALTHGVIRAAQDLIRQPRNDWQVVLRHAATPPVQIAGAAEPSIVFARSAGALLRWANAGKPRQQ